MFSYIYRIYIFSNSTVCLFEIRVKIILVIFFSISKKHLRLKIRLFPKSFVNAKKNAFFLRAN